MKLTFWAQDSIYKIFKLLKKVPRGKQVDIFFDTHPLLEDTRWLSAFVKHIRELEIIVTITTKNQYIAEQLQTYGIQTTYVWSKNRVDRVLQTASKILGKSTPTISPAEYIKSKLALIAELLVLGLIIYLFWWTISPKATMSISPTTTIQPISYGFLVYPVNSKPELTVQPLWFPWYTWLITTSVSKTIDLQSFSTELFPSKWVVRLYNTLTGEISLIAGTTLLTETNIPYTLDTRIRLPGWTPKNPWTVDVAITANNYFPDGTPIGEEGNITKETRLLIEKLPESSEQQAIWALPVADITNGKTVLSGTVVSSDIQRLEKQLLEDITQQLDGLIRTNNTQRNHIPIPLSEEIQITVNRFVTNAQPWESASFLQGTMEVTISYPYIDKADLEKQSRLYLQQRATSNIKKSWLSLERMDFYESREISTGVYILPTTIQTFETYDFTKDSYGISEKLKYAIAGKTKAEATAAALLFDEIHEVTITISPFWYNAIPKSVEKITITTQHNTQSQK